MLRTNPLSIWSGWYHRRPFIVEAITIGLVLFLAGTVLDPWLAAEGRQSSLMNLFGYSVFFAIVSASFGQLGRRLRRNQGKA